MCRQNEYAWVYNRSLILLLRYRPAQFLNQEKENTLCCDCGSARSRRASPRSV